MRPLLDELDPAMAGEGIARLVRIREQASGLHAVTAFSSPAHDIAFGGIRRAPYRSLDHAAAAAGELASAMGRKLRLADADAGGAKTVIHDVPELDRSRAYEALGRAVEELGGAYHAGPDVGTDERDLERMRAVTTHVNHRDNRPGPSTAHGVLAAMRAVVARRLDAPTMAGVTVAIQGLGSVGAAIAATLASDGARLIVADPDAARVAAVLDAAPAARVVHHDDIVTVEADVFCPCALGGVLGPGTIAGARIICGSANGQLIDDAVGRALHEAGVLWVPDVIANVGAVIEGVLVARRGERDQVEIAAALDAIGPRTLDVLDEADRRGEAPIDEVRRRCGEGR